ncbi:OB-fold nucleic acid binding domain-containing protein [Thalassococcus sp. S3]|uniref:OB-fold nucleic acid binding domain-containing protein n=1 Tax=Thalassococcus sp. S3 TaxID=2017482 RepID=UPI00102474CB|nr:OB-fold nucleic acid binding domain-containing protein [Thalassococcus sp. S3]QBF33459.1 hypothetical protein CFI11_19915 [Thalassococcus sp. S3]
MIGLLPLTTVLALSAETAYVNEEPTPVGALERGTLVTVEGIVTRITDEDEFRLQDATGTVRIYVGPNWVPAGVGEAVRIEGVVNDDLGALEVHAHSLTRADGTVIEFARRAE